MLDQGPHTILGGLGIPLGFPLLAAFMVRIMLEDPTTPPAEAVGYHTPDIILGGLFYGLFIALWVWDGREKRPGPNAKGLTHAPAKRQGEDPEV